MQAIFVCKKILDHYSWHQNSIDVELKANFGVLKVKHLRICNEEKQVKAIS